MLIVFLFVSYAHVILCHFFSSSWDRGLAAVALATCLILPLSNKTKRSNCHEKNIYHAHEGGGKLSNETGVTQIASSVF